MNNLFKFIKLYQVKALSNQYDIGDWIATGIDGEHWAIKDDIFKKTYTEADG